MIRRILIQVLLISALVPWGSLEAKPRVANPSERRIQQLDELSALWSYYKRVYLISGRVSALDEGGITTSEGQSYAMLRAVWQDDRAAFKSVWSWTRQNLQVRKADKLFAWKWHGRVLDQNAATDADTDIALALLLASHRFSEPIYRQQALEIMADIWRQEVVKAGDGNLYPTGGNWAPQESYPTIHVAYLAPYAYQFFASVDSRFPWKNLVASSYRVLNWIYDEQGLKLPPEKIYLDKRTGALSLKHPESGRSSRFSYDAFPTFWRVAVDSQWYSRAQRQLRAKMLRFFEEEWKSTGRLLDHYALDGQPQSRLEGLPLYATVHSLARVQNLELAREIRERKLDPLWSRAMQGRGVPYYSQNWFWFDRAFELNVVRTHTEFLGFLRPFDFESFSNHFPWLLMAVVLALFLLSRFHRIFKLGFLFGAFFLCLRYLSWRLFSSLNFLEASGPFISIALWIAEAYCFSTVVLLLIQVGLSGGKKDQSRPKSPRGFEPSVDIFIPIYSESLEILEKTLIAARAIRYTNKRIYVCDDSHRETVREMAECFGAGYFQGPKKHAKAGNLNNAIARTSGELLLIFDTDHIPVGSFLEETVPYFADPEIGFIQTPHHFYNEDIFQRAFGTGLQRVPDEQDMFNHAIQSGRHHWNGSFFVGSGAVFRRAAIEGVGGFKLMSITEDIHTSQHLHAAGWKSAFVDKDLAVGLTAENLASFIVQRRRWMLGCLQIFFKDNPLLCRGLSIRQRIGYFGSLYYFLFPIARVIFWMTPLAFLMFHWHPIFSEVSVLVAYLLPYMILLPLISSVLLPGWPRMLWGVAYEMACSFVLFRSMFDLFLPKNMGFKVTPKGITSEKRSFDFASAKANLFVTGITVFAIGKGLLEFHAFGIEKDAYFFNIAWALLNLLLLGISLLVAWEKPQRRTEDRISKAIPFTLIGRDGLAYEGRLHDISLGGFSIRTARRQVLPPLGEITLNDPDHPSLKLRAARVYLSRSGRCAGYKFVDVKAVERESLLLMTFASEATWRNAHERRVRGNAGMIWAFFVGIVRCLLPARTGQSYGGHPEHEARTRMDLSEPDAPVEFHAGECRLRAQEKLVPKPRQIQHGDRQL